MHATLSALEWPRQAVRLEMEWFEFQPGDGTKYILGIIENSHGFFPGTRPGSIGDYPDWVTVIYHTGYYSFPKTEFELEEPHEGTLIYFEEKMRTSRHATKMLCRFIHQMLYKRDAFRAIKELNK